ISGIWYDAARAPDVESTQCLSFSMPSADVDNNITLELEYVETDDNKWEHSKKTLSFPFDEQAKKGIVSSSGVTYKVAKLDSASRMYICAYASVFQGFKVLTRQRELSDQTKSEIQQEFKELDENASLVWVEQSDEKCNSAMRTAGGALVALAFALLVVRRNI
ncbi:hypothetical protein KR222_010341, partial [Zaprionus bogoriensis]